MRTRYIVTGANGHLGNTIIRMLRSTKAEIFGLILPNENLTNKDNIHYIKGDVRIKDSLRPLFENPITNKRDEDTELFVIHTAGIIDISEKGSPNLYNVNVNGTKNILSLCEEYKVKRLCYVSSVHAIPEKDGDIITEVNEFSPDTVVGAYARTKAEATEAVLEEGRKGGLDVVVVQPSGIIGPYDTSGNHLVQMIAEYLKGTLPACVKGGYDFVDVRDVAKGCLQALDIGKSNNCYILSNCYYEIKDVLAMVRKYVNLKKLVVLPIWIAKMAAPLLEWFAKLKHKRPLYTSYSLHTLKTKDRFSHAKATHDLGYEPRGLKDTIRDTVFWFKDTTNIKFATVKEKVRKIKAKAAMPVLPLQLAPAVVKVNSGKRK